MLRFKGRFVKKTQLKKYVMNKKKLVGINDTLVNNERASIGDSIVRNEDIVNDRACEHEQESSQCHM